MQMYNINDLSYNAKENPEWFTRALYGGRLISSGIIRVLTGIKGGELLSMIDLKNKVLQIDGKDCAWTPNQIIKLSEKTATVTTYKINLEECIDVLENKRTVYMLSPGAENDALPPELEAATMALIAIGLSNEIEEMIVGGNSAVDPNQFNGMVQTLLASTDAAKLVGSGTTVDKTTILGIIESGYDAVPEEVLQAEDAGTMYVFGSYTNRRVIKKALAAVQASPTPIVHTDWTVDNSDPKNPIIHYGSLEYIAVKGIDNGTFIFIDGSNALLLTDLLTDTENVELGQFPKPFDNKVFIRGRMRLGFVIPFEAEAVIWSTSITVAQTAGSDVNALKIVPNSLVFSAAGETKTAIVQTKDTAAVLDALAANPIGFTITKGTTTAGLTTLSIVAADNRNNRDPRVATVPIKVTGKNIVATLTLNQRAEDITGVIA